MFNDARIITDITPKYASIFYEDGVPYLKYIGTAMLDNGTVVEAEFPKMDLKFKNITTEKEEMWHDDNSGRIGSRYLVSMTQNIYADRDNIWVNIRAVKREVSLKQLEKELGYKIELTDMRSKDEF